VRPNVETIISANLDTTRSVLAEAKSALSILLVEDNLINQKILMKQLQRLGCTVHVANHGLEALDFIKTSKYWHENQQTGTDVDVILMDWEMPVMDGLTSTRQLREWELSGLVTKPLAVLGTTANARQEQVHTALAAGLDDVIAKPFTVTALMSRIQALKGV
jgi:CheY-like chemotaxis protein